MFKDLSPGQFCLVNSHWFLSYLRKRKFRERSISRFCNFLDNLQKLKMPWLSIREIKFPRNGSILGIRKYSGESKKKILSQCTVLSIVTEKYERKMGVHWIYKKLPWTFYWIHPKTKKNSSKIYERKVRESLVINQLKTINEIDKTFNVLKKDNVDFVTTNSWKSLFEKLENL